MYRYHLLLGIYLLVCGTIFGFLHSFVSDYRQQLSFLEKHQALQSFNQIKEQSTVLLVGEISTRNQFMPPLQAAEMVVGCYEQYDSEDGWELEETYEQPLLLTVGKQEVALPDPEPCPEGSFTHTIDDRHRMSGLKIHQELTVIATVIKAQPLQLDVEAVHAGNKLSFMKSLKDSMWLMRLIAGIALFMTGVMFVIHYLSVRKKIRLARG